jgi:hypothetical protein
MARDVQDPGDGPAAAMQDGPATGSLRTVLDT